MSFALTVEAMRRREKDVTRRLGWLRLKPSHVVTPVLKCMGLKRGETVTRVCVDIRIVDVRREPLNLMLLDLAYGKAECRREGFAHLTPEEFVKMFCDTHRGCTPETLLTRIVFSYIEESQLTLM